MRRISQAILDAASSVTSQVPCMFADVYATTAARYAIDSQAQWIGLHDPMVASDINCSFTRINGTASLAPGAAITATYAGTPSTYRTIAMYGYVQCFWHATWNWKGTSWKPTLDSWNAVITSQVDSMAIPFTAQATMIADSMIVRASVAYSGVGNNQCYAYFVDELGKQIGKRITFYAAVGVANYTLTGLQATLSKGRKYNLVIGYNAYTTSTIAYQYWTSISSSFSLTVYDYAVVSPSWKIPTQGAQGISIGGFEGYAASGSFTRQFPMSTLPLNDGALRGNDIVPAGTTLTVDAYYTDSDTVALETNLTNFTLYASGISSGVSIPAHKYWRLKFSFTSNTAHDESPQVQRAEITYKDSPYVLGTHIQRADTYHYGYAVPWVLPLLPSGVTRTSMSGSKCINSVSANSSKMNPQLATSITGKMSISLAPDANVISMMREQLRGKQVTIRAGYLVNGLPVSDNYYNGIVTDAVWSGSQYTLTIEDDMNIVDVQVPTTKAGAVWSSASTYALGDVIVYGNASYVSLQAANLNHTPSSSPTWWSNNGTVWQDIVYTTLTSPDAPLNWHLADVCADILTNHVNLPTQRIDLQSIADVKALYPNMRGSRIIAKPVSALGILQELAWLLRSQWVMRQGKLALMAEPTSTPVAVITDRDIQSGLVYGRGWSSLKNTCLILSGYSGDGQGQEQFYQSYAYTDTASVTDYEMVGLEVFRDKWSVAEAELTARATEYVNRWRNGRRVVTYNASMRLLELEVGDVVTFSSVEMPPHDNGALNYIIIGQDINWLTQSIKHTLLEI